MVISNSGPLIALGKLGLLELLQELYGVVYTPRSVAKEVVDRGMESGCSDAWATQEAIHQAYVSVVDLDSPMPEDISGLPLGLGEKECLCVAIRDKAEFILLDEAKARQEARSRGPNVKGTVGVIVQAFRAGHLTFDRVEFYMREIMARDDIWIADELCIRVLNALSDEVDPSDVGSGRASKQT